MANKWAVAMLVTLCWAVTATLATGYYYYQFNDLSAKVQGTPILVNLGINYGDGRPTLWFNETKAQMGMTLLDVTEDVAEVNYKVYLGMGANVESIGGVKNSYPYYWMWWMWTEYGWYDGAVAADKYLLIDGEILLWYYEDTSISPLPKPP